MGASIHQQLESINRRPAPYEHVTTADLWTDKHIASRMLIYHLDGSVDIASRRTNFVDTSAAWIIDHFELDEGKSVAYFGCGPGPYTDLL